MTQYCIYAEIFTDNTEEILRKNLQSIFANGTANQFKFFDYYDYEKNANFDGTLEILKKGSPAVLYSYVKNYTIKLELTYNVIMINPIEPFPLKKGYGNQYEKVDLSFYIERLLELCESFFILDLYAEIIEPS